MFEREKSGYSQRLRSTGEEQHFELDQRVRDECGRRRSRTFYTADSSGEGPNLSKTLLSSCISIFEHDWPYKIMTSTLQTSYKTIPEIEVLLQMETPWLWRCCHTTHSAWAMSQKNPTSSAPPGQVWELASFRTDIQVALAKDAPQLLWGKIKEMVVMLRARDIIFIVQIQFMLSRSR